MPPFPLPPEAGSSDSPALAATAAATTDPVLLSEIREPDVPSPEPEEGTAVDLDEEYPAEPTAVWPAITAPGELLAFPQLPLPTSESDPLILTIPSYPTYPMADPPKEPRALLILLAMFMAFCLLVTVLCAFVYLIVR